MQKRYHFILSDEQRTTLTENLLGILLRFCKTLFHTSSTNKVCQTKKESLDIYTFRVFIREKRLFLFLQVRGKMSVNIGSKLRKLQKLSLIFSPLNVFPKKKFQEKTQ